MIYGYARVSSKDQNLNRQIDAFEKRGIETKNIFWDKQSGKDFNRDGYESLMEILEQEDCVFIGSIDRLGRNYDEIMNEWKRITREKEVDIVVIDMPLLDTRRGKDLLGTFIGDLVLQILAFVAENQRINIRENQRAGIESARKRGVQFGRPRKITEEEFLMSYKHVKNGNVTVHEVLEHLEISIATYYRYVKNLKK